MSEVEGLFDKLEKEKGSSLTNKEKERVLENLDLPKSLDGCYLDAFDKEVGYNGIKTLKRPYTKLPLTQLHINEIEKCSQDIFYFVRNYCRILTKEGVTFPEFRQYQIEFLRILSTGNDVVSSLPRQCVAGETEIITPALGFDENYKIVDIELDQSIEKVFKAYTTINELLDDKNGKIELENNNPEFIKSYCFKEDIKTDKGFIEASEIHKTIKYDIYEIELENGLKLRASEKHVVIDKDYNEIYIKDCLGKELITKDGISKVISKKFIRNDHCYDITLSKHHLYYTNGILSHNSGKSVTTALYLLWKALFTKDINIGICANQLSLAMEVLDKIKKIFIQLPIWLQQGLEAWNKTYIVFENGTRIMTAAGNSDSFRGFTCLEGSEKIEVFNTETEEIEFKKIKDLYETLNEIEYLIKTPNGFKKFEGISRSIFNSGLKFTFLDKTSISVTEEHLFKHENSYKKAKYFKVGDKIQNKEIIKIEKIQGNFYEPVEVEGHEYVCNDLVHHNCSIIYVDEVAFISNTDWQGIVDSVLPSQSALAQKQAVFCSTPNGMNHWYHLVQQAKKENSGYEFFTMDWREVPRYNKDGTKADPEEYKEKQIKKNGKKWFAQNFELAFLGSSSTLINEEALKNFDPLEENEIIFNSLFDGLRILEDPKRSHNYIIGVDPAKEGIDKTAIQVFDVTSLPFKQVACCNLDDSYLKVPGKLFDLGNYYNQAMIVVENNIDNTIVDTLFYHYDYEGEIYKEKVKNILGFRTTIKTKKILLSVLKKLIEENKLIIKDKETINEFFVFIEQKNGSFSAEEGYHDDLVMACMIALAPFIDIKSFDDFKGFISLVEKRNEELEAEEAETELFYSMGFSTELTDEDVEETKNRDFSNLSYF